MENNAISIEQSRAKEHSDVDSKQCENSTQNEFNSARFDNVTKKTKKSPITSTPL